MIMPDFKTIPIINALIINAGMNTELCVIRCSGHTPSNVTCASAEVHEHRQIKRRVSLKKVIEYHQIQYQCMDYGLSEKGVKVWKNS